MRGPKHADGNFAAIGNKQLVDFGHDDDGGWRGNPRRLSVAAVRRIVNATSRTSRQSGGEARRMRMYRMSLQRRPLGLWSLRLSWLWLARLFTLFWLFISGG